MEGVDPPIPQRDHGLMIGGHIDFMHGRDAAGHAQLPVGQVLGPDGGDAFGHGGIGRCDAGIGRICTALGRGGGTGKAHVAKAIVIGAGRKQVMRRGVRPWGGGGLLDITLVHFDLNPSCRFDRTGITAAGRQHRFLATDAIGAGLRRCSHNIA